MPQWNKKSDGNQAACRAAGHAIGAENIPIDKLGGAGADDIWFFRGLVFIVEYKDPEQNWTFTKSEKELQAKCYRQLIVYNVIKYPEELVELLTQ